MTVSANVYVVIGIVSTAAAQIALKIASGSGSETIRLSGWGLLSVGAYGLSFLSYFLALKTFEISKIQPIMMASITTIIALYGASVGEHVSMLRLAGILLGVFSVVLISQS
jgi:multidrug transporter EmrE-like cation transporter